MIIDQVLWVGGIGDTLAAAAKAGAAFIMITLLLPITTASIVLGWHGLRGTDPGPSPAHLLRLIELLTNALYQRRK